MFSLSFPSEIVGGNVSCVLVRVSSMGVLFGKNSSCHEFHVQVGFIVQLHTLVLNLLCQKRKSPVVTFPFSYSTTP